MKNLNIIQKINFDLVIITNLPNEDIVNIYNDKSKSIIKTQDMLKKELKLAFTDLKLKLTS